MSSEQNSIRGWWQRRGPDAGWLLLIASLGFACKFYPGPAADWVRNDANGIIYVLFWCQALFLLKPASRPGLIAVAVTAVTCLLEFMQLWHPPLLEYIRSYFLGRAVLGTTFCWRDFPYYAIGGLAAWGWLRYRQSLSRRDISH